MKVDLLRSSVAKKGSGGGVEETRWTGLCSSIKREHMTSSGNDMNLQTAKLLLIVAVMPESATCLECNSTRI